MGNVYPFVTNDGSVGLYNEDFDDIYHSVTGAYSEAREKFVANSELENFFCNNNSTIKVLDLCYGIGYNTKSLIQEFSKIVKKNNLLNKHTETIYSDNIFNPILEIDAVDLNKNLMILSPLFKKFRRYNLKKQNLPTSRIEKYLAKNVSGELYDDWVDVFLLEKLVSSGKFSAEYSDLLSEIKKNYFYEYLSRRRMAYMRLLSGDSYYDDTPAHNLTAFVHNIYYHHISSWYKSSLKAFINKHINISFNSSDAREYVKLSERTYDLIFLDAFSPDKCPCLWTYDFIKLLYEHLSPGGRLITYSSAASIRNALLKSGFYVGKIYNAFENKFAGTIGVKNKSFIKYELAEKDLRLINSKSGILYRDENLNALNEAIRSRREVDVQNSNLMSSTKAAKEVSGV